MGISLATQEQITVDYALAWLQWTLRECAATESPDSHSEPLTPVALSHRWWLREQRDDLCQGVGDGIISPSMILAGRSTVERNLLFVSLVGPMSALFGRIVDATVIRSTAAV